MRKYIGNSIIVLGSLVLVIGMFYVFTVHSFAAAPTNSSSAGNAVAVIQCEVDNDDWAVDHAQLGINAAGCKCEINSPDWPQTKPLDCDNNGDGDDNCTECLASLQVAGCSIISANGYFDTEDQEEKANYTLSCNAGPFLTRLGGCPCVL